VKILLQFIQIVGESPIMYEVKHVLYGYPSEN